MCTIGRSAKGIGQEEVNTSAAAELSTVPDAPSPIPERIGAYRILSILGRGGMGTVYKARHETLCKEFALKVLHPGISPDAGSQTPIQAEGRAGARIRHPNVVDVSDCAQENGVWYLVMELVEGESLSKRIRRSLPTESETVRIALLLAKGLAVLMSVMCFTLT